MTNRGLSGNYRAAAPDFILAGAPKCGTTAIHTALERHPQLRMSTIKEPHYFAYDFPGLCKIDDDAEYADLFRHRGHVRRLHGESSAFYLRSETAVPAILQRNPDLKVIAVVRNPIDLFQSLHNELVKERSENVDLLTAWQLQERRASGRDLPPHCREPRALQYRSVCMLGEQIRNLFAHVRPANRQVFIFENLAKNPRETLAAIQDFIGMRQVDLRLPRMNSFAYPRSALLADLTRNIHMSRVMNHAQIRFKPALNKVGIKPVSWLVDMNLRSASKPAINPEFRAVLVERFRADVADLGSLLQIEIPWADFRAPDARGVQSVGSNVAG